jgi:hypothetical protein
MAKRPTKAQREQAQTDEFRETASSLLRLRHNDWNDWEYDWLRDEVRRHPSYVYTEKERAILEKLQVYAKSFTHYAGRTVQELIQLAYPYRCDLDEDDQQFIERLHGWGASELKRRQIRRLAGICRSFGELDADLDETAYLSSTEAALA